MVSDKMVSGRRNFLKSMALTVGGASLASNSLAEEQRLKTDYSRLGQVLKQPVLKQELFSEPIIMESIELLSPTVFPIGSPLR